MNQKIKILIVDDDEAGRETLEGLLMAHGYELIFAENGPEALRQAELHGPDIILLDVMMPGMDGYEVCKRIRQSPQLAEAPVLMVTALDDKNSKLRGIEAGADDFISKPFDRTELRARIKSITRLNRYRRLVGERAKFEWVINQTEEAYLIVDSNDLIIYANNSARLFLGIAPEEKLPSGATFDELSNRQYLKEPLVAWKHWKASFESIFPRYLVRAETPSSKGFWLQVTAVLCPIDDEFGRVIKLSNVTQKMAAQRDIWTLNSAISHKLRTPLTGILGALEMLSEDDGLSAREMAELREVAWTSAKRLHAQIEDILQYLNSTGMAQQGTGFHLKDLKKMCTQISSNLRLENVNISMGESQQDCQISLSDRALELAVLEILENCKKFHPSHTPKIDITATQTSTDVVLELRDDGINLPPEELANLMIPYHQSEKRFTGESVGMGLGLAMVASLLWDIGGGCTMTNRQDQPGIVIRLRIPVQTAQNLQDPISETKTTINSGSVAESVGRNMQF